MNLHRIGGTVAIEPDESLGRWCSECGQTWPCRTQQWLQGDLDAER